MSELSPTVKAAAESAGDGGSFDVNAFAFDLFLQQMLRDQMDNDEEYSNPIVTNEIAKIVAHSISGFGV